MDNHVRRLVDAIERKIESDAAEPVILRIKFGRLMWWERLLNRRMPLAIVFLPDDPQHRDDWLRTARGGDEFLFTNKHCRVMPDAWFEEQDRDEGLSDLTQ